MRLDKYLKISRIIKRRTVAKEVCDSGRAMLNGRSAKAGSEVNPGDNLRLDLGVKVLEVKVLATPEVIRANEAKDLYEVMNERSKD